MSTQKCYMPDVDPIPTERLEEIFNLAHKTSLGLEHCVAMLSPGRLMRRFLAPAPNTMAPAMADTMKRILALPSKRVVAIGFTAVPIDADMQEVSAAIPFLGFLIGFAYIGHSVVLFEGNPLAFEAGIKGTDMLLVDYEMTPFLANRWTETAFRLMRTPEVNIYNANNPQHSRVQRIIDPINNPYNQPHS